LKSIIHTSKGRHERLWVKEYMYWKKIFLLGAIFCITLFTITACGTKTDEIPTDEIPIDETPADEIQTDIVVSSKDEIFELKLYVDKNTYSTEGIIQCYATVEYVGDKDSITIYSSDPLVGFGLKDDKYFDGGYAVNDVLISTTFKKGEIVRFDYMKSGGWSGDDTNADFYKKFFAEKELILPAGNYEISASIDGSFDSDDMLGTKYKQTVKTTIKVTD